VAQVTASPHACDTRKLVGPCTGRKRRKAMGVVLPWLGAMLYAMLQNTSILKIVVICSLESHVIFSHTYLSGVDRYTIRDVTHHWNINNRYELIDLKYVHLKLCYCAVIALSRLFVLA
jgi:hypothetical protein